MLLLLLSEHFVEFALYRVNLGAVNAINIQNGQNVFVLRVVEQLALFEKIDELFSFVKLRFQLLDVFLHFDKRVLQFYFEVFTLLSVFEKNRDGFKYYDRKSYKEKKCVERIPLYCLI